MTLPHGSCKDDEAGATIVHPRRGRDEDCTQQKYGSVPHPDEVKVEEKDIDEVKVVVKDRAEDESTFGGSTDSAQRPNGASDVVSLMYMYFL